MNPTSQKNLPVAFNLDGAEIQLPIRPEDLTRTEVSRVNVVNTLDGAWIDFFGRGLTQITINGHTGWGQGKRPDGTKEFEKLRGAIQTWMKKREQKQESRLMFADTLNNNYCAEVAPTAFSLKRSKSQPLLMFYNISLVVISDSPGGGVASGSVETDNGYKDREGNHSLATPAAQTSLQAALSALQSVGDALASANDAVNSVREAVQAVDRAVVQPIMAIGAQASRLSTQVSSIINAVSSGNLAALGGMAAATASSSTSGTSSSSGAGGGSGVGAAAMPTSRGELVAIAASTAPFAKAGKELWGAAAAQPDTSPDTRFLCAAMAREYSNLHCLIQNGYGNAGAGILDYSPFYGASNCSSTAGGRPLSPLTGMRGLEILNRPSPALWSMSAEATDALMSLAHIDPIHRPSAADMLRYAMALFNGVKLT